jgi:hypothetical protein
MISFPLSTNRPPTAPRFVNLPTDALTPWQSALARARAGTGIATVMMLGASTAEGSAGVTDVMTKSGFYQWRGLKAQSYPTFGDFSRSTMSAAHTGLASATGFPFTHDQPAISYSLIGPWWLPTWNAVGSQLMHYTHPTQAFGYRGRSFRVYYWDPGVQDGGPDIGAGRTWTWNLNGGANQVIPALGRTNTIKYIEITSATPGWSDTDNQVINFVTQSVAGACLIIGVLSCPGIVIGGSGICYVQAGQTGDCLGDLGNIAPINVYPADKLARLIAPNEAAPLFTPNPLLSPPFAPDLAFIEPFDDAVAVLSAGGLLAAAAIPNYTVNGVYPDEYLHLLRRITQSLRGKSTGCTTVHALPNFPDGITSDVNPGAIPTNNVWHYFWAHKTAAELNDDILVKTDPDWNERGLALGFLSPGNPHPNDAGALNRAQKWASVGL